MAMAQQQVTVLGAGYSGLTTAAELSLRGAKVQVVARELGNCPPITIVGTQSRRFPGMSASTENFSQDDLLERELATINRFVALAADPKRTGVRVVPGVKVSRQAGVWWNVRELGDDLKKRSSETQRAMELVCEPRRVDARVIDRLKAAGYASVDQTPVIMIESAVYFRHLLGITKANGGSVCLGYSLPSGGAAATRAQGAAVVNCLGTSAASAGAVGTYSNKRGEVLMFDRCPGDMPFYLVDDDKQCAITQVPSGELYMSGEGEPRDAMGWDARCTEKTLADGADMCRALFGAQKVPTVADVRESWALDRPTRREGFNVGLRSHVEGPLVLENNGHAGAGVAASWSCAATVADHLQQRGVLAGSGSAAARAKL